MLQLTSEDKHSIGVLLKPSWLSALVAICAGLIVSIGVIIAFNVNNSGLQQQLSAWQSDKPQKALTTPDQTLPESDKPTLQGSWPLVLIWGLIGLAAYSFTMSIVHSISEAEALKQSLDYVHADRRSMLETTAEHLALRLVAFVTLAVLLILFIKKILPYAITTAHASASDVLSASGLLYALLAFAVVTLTVHLQIIFLRLALGKIRIFSNP